MLASGARMHIDRHEADGAKVRLYYGTGFVEMNSTVVRGYEAEEHWRRYRYRRPMRLREPAAVRRGAVRPPRWNWRTPPPTATACRGNWYAA